MEKKNIVITCGIEDGLEIERVVISGRKVSVGYRNNRGNEHIDYIWNS
jgi:hypothetical protein